jgi:hypothetical protein
MLLFFSVVLGFFIIYQEVLLLLLSADEYVADSLASFVSQFNNKFGLGTPNKKEKNCHRTGVIIFLFQLFPPQFCSTTSRSQRLDSLRASSCSSSPKKTHGVV